MKKKLLQITEYKIRLLIFLLFFVSYSFAQEGVYNIAWKENEKIVSEEKGKQIKSSFFNFENATYLAGYFPVYNSKFRIVDDTRVFRLGSLTYAPVPDSMLKDVYTGWDLEGITPEIRQFTASDRYKYIDIKIPAIRINNENGKIERLLNFEIVSAEGKKTDGQVTHAFKEKSATNSLLATGSWYRFKVNRTGIYKITYGDIESMGLPNPANIRLFGHGSMQLSYWNSDLRPEDMVEIPIFMSRGSDDIFNSGDYILFYAEGPVAWHYDTVYNIFRQKLHQFSGEISYFLTTSHGQPNIIPQTDNRHLTSNIDITTYDDYAYSEREYINLVGSGRNWYSRKIDGKDFDTIFNFPSILSGATVKVLVKAAGRSTNIRQGTLMVNDLEAISSGFPTISTGASYLTYAKDKIFQHSYNSSSAQQKIGFRYQKIDAGDLCYLDYITVNAQSEIRLNGDMLLFRSLKSTGSGMIASYTIKNASSDTRIWDVTDINNITEIRGELTGSEYRFKAPSDNLRQYIAVNINGEFTKPNIAGGGLIANQNLRALPVHNYIIVAPEVFLEQAERLANHRRIHDGFKTLVVTPQMIYNEFSSGTPDICALRDFFRHQFNKGTSSDSLRYVVLFGDGSYANHLNTPGNTNYILSYQSVESLDPVSSYVADDFFGLLGDGEGEVTGDIDIGIGRLTVKLNDGSDYEAVNVVNKLIYYDTSRFGNWRRTLLFMGDDGYDPGGYHDGYQHMQRADKLSKSIQDQYKGYIVEKVYLDAYPQFNTATGSSYPDAKQDLLGLLDKGVLIYLYSGHGGENQITGERTLEKSDVMKMKNKHYLPLFITATCQFSRFDHVSMMDIESDWNSVGALTTLGEEALLNPEGGAIALFGTTRLVYGGYNEILLTETVPYLLNRNKGTHYRLGDVLRQAKNNPANTNLINKLKFTLLGDPATRLAFPEFLVLTDSINGHSVNDASSDTVRAFSEVNVTGYVAWEDSTLIDDFNGFVYPHVYDKAKMITTFGNDGEPPFTYEDQNNLLYRGKATVTNGRFKFTFIVPKDINYTIGRGKLSYYAENGVIDAKGEFDNIIVGGTGELSEDYEGPKINLFMNDTNFIPGGMTNSEPYIYAQLYDDLGINISGIGIGHDIVALLDENIYSPYILNDYYEGTVDDHKSGTVRYPLRDLEEGEHTVLLKAWDISNNSSEAMVSFVVVNGGPVLGKIYNYPNPATEFTSFVYTHNMPGEEHEITLEIFDISGRLINRLHRKQFEEGFTSAPLTWNLRGTGNSVLSGGLFPYQLKVTTSLGTTTINEKLIIMR